MTERPAFIRELEKALGVAVLVRSVEPGPPARIAATLMLDSRSTDMTAVGESEAEAWQDLGRVALAWQNDDQLNVRIFGGGWSSQGDRGVGTSRVTISVGAIT